jgi:hypothetical protein
MHGIDSQAGLLSALHALELDIYGILMGYLWVLSVGRGRDSQAELLSASHTPDWALMGAGWGYVRNITLR